MGNQEWWVDVGTTDKDQCERVLVRWSRSSGRIIAACGDSCSTMPFHVRLESLRYLVDPQSEVGEDRGRVCDWAVCWTNVRGIAFDGRFSVHSLRNASFLGRSNLTLFALR